MVWLVAMLQFTVLLDISRETPTRSGPPPNRGKLGHRHGRCKCLVTPSFESRCSNAPGEAGVLAFWLATIPPVRVLAKSIALHKGLLSWDQRIIDAQVKDVES